MRKVKALKSNVTVCVRVIRFIQLPNRNTFFYNFEKVIFENITESKVLNHAGDTTYRAVAILRQIEAAASVKISKKKEKKLQSALLVLFLQ